MLLPQLLKDDITLIEAQTCFNLLLKELKDYFGEHRTIFLAVGFGVISCVPVSLSIFSFEIVSASAIIMYFAFTVGPILGLVCLSETKKMDGELVSNGST